MKVTLEELQLPLRKALQTAHGAIAVRRIIRVTATEDGFSGHSEAAPLPGFGLETYEQALHQLESWAERVARGGSEAANAHGGAHTFGLPQTPSAFAAAAGAVAQLDAALEGVALPELLTGESSYTTSPSSHTQSASSPKHLAVQSLISDPDPGQAAQQAREAADSGHLAVKLKVAIPNTSTAAEVARIHEVRLALPAAVALRLDANAGWDWSAASRVLRNVSRLDVDFVETPTPQPADWAQLARRTGARIAVDEHLSGTNAAEVLDQLIAAGAIAVAILKPATVGGPQAAYDLACRASVSGVGSVVSSFVCGADGLRIARDVAQAVAPNQVHGVGTGAMFAEPLPADVTPQAGYLRW